MKKTGLFLAIVLMVGLAAVGYIFRRSGDFGGAEPSKTPVNGGEIVSTYRSEPASFNRLVAPFAADDLTARLVHDTLLRVDRQTGQIEPRLATSWASTDGVTWTLTLREGVQFSDGQPFSAEDVLFSFRAMFDDKVKSEIASSLLINGKPMTARALDPRTIVVTFPSAYAPGIGLLEALPILPAHKLRAALDAGELRTAWSLSAPAAEIVGLGPFMIDSYVPGERLTFKRNPHFWKKDSSGRAMPYVDRIQLQFTPSQDAEIVRLQAGATDLIEDRVRVEDLASLRALEKDGRLALHDAGVSISPDMLWFNLDPSSQSAHDHPWLQREEFRHAVSEAIDRSKIVNTVFLGEALPIAGPITPGHGEWYAADLLRPVFNLEDAKHSLDALGILDRNGDGLRDDPSGKTASFTLLTQKGHSVRERTANMIQEQLRQAGLQVDLIPMEPKAMTNLWSAGKYDAILFAIEFDSFDPGRNLDFWMSNGPFHFWHPNQRTPSTTWEAEIDSLMARQSTTSNLDERRKLFADAQRVLAKHEPVLYFAAPKVIAASSARLGGVQASVLAPNVLWNAEALYIKSGTTDRQR